MHSEQDLRMLVYLLFVDDKSAVILHIHFQHWVILYSYQSLLSLTRNFRLLHGGLNIFRLICAQPDLYKVYTAVAHFRERIDKQAQLSTYVINDGYANHKEYVIFCNVAFPFRSINGDGFNESRPLHWIIFKTDEEGVI